MEENSFSNSSSLSHARNGSPQVASLSNHEAEVSGVNGSVNGARYRLMSPAKLPISRSACITIPPGLSPTSFLESPVLLSNMKAEPSPTTGSFLKPQLMQSSCGKSISSMEKPFSNGSSIDETNTNSFEFRFHNGTSSTSASGLSHADLMYPSGSSRNTQIVYQDQNHSPPSAPSSMAPQSLAAGTHGPLLCNTNQPNEGEQSDVGIHASPCENKESIPLVTAERTSDDGYNWRKYGQKLVKGSEFPRSYYKCTYPNCEVKKIFERSPSGHITEIIYKGSHDHPKPQPARRNNPGALLSIQEDKPEKDLSFTGQMDKLNANNMEQNGSPVPSPLQGNDHGGDDDIEDDSFLKRRRLEDGIDITPVIKAIREPRVVVQTVSEINILDDGYRWRKYGQKIVRGNPNPRSYYKCTNAGCQVRKHVERASHDPKAVITTYEGKHNHDVPTAKNSSSHELASTMQYNNTSRIRSNETSNSISLDLGVGIRSNLLENKTNQQTTPTLYNEAGRSQVAQNINPSMIVLQPSQIPMSYGRF